MIKKRKTGNPQVGNVYGVPLADSSWGLVQVCYVAEATQLGIIMPTLVYAGRVHELKAE